MKRARRELRRRKREIADHNRALDRQLRIRKVEAMLAQIGPMIGQNPDLLLAGVKGMTAEQVEEVLVALRPYLRRTDETVAEAAD